MEERSWCWEEVTDGKADEELINTPRLVCPVSEDQPLFSPLPRQTLKMDLVIPWKESLLLSSDNFSVFSEIGRV